MRALAKGALAAVGLAAVGWALAGCAPTVWSKAGTTAAERDAALEACEAYAQAQMEEDFPARIEETQRGISSGEDDSVLLNDFRRYDDRTRRSALIGSCMRQSGYTDDPVPATEGADDAGAPADAS